MGGRLRALVGQFHPESQLPAHGGKHVHDWERSGQLGEIWQGREGADVVGDTGVVNIAVSVEEWSVTDTYEDQ